MPEIDVSAARELAHLLFHFGLDADANYGDIGELRALAQGPYIRIAISDADSATRKKLALQALLLQFYIDCGLIDLDRQLIARRLGQFGELLLVTQFTEFFDIASESEVSEQLAATNLEMARFTEHLKKRMKKRLI